MAMPGFLTERLLVLRRKIALGLPSCRGLQTELRLVNDDTVGLWSPLSVKLSRSSETSLRHAGFSPVTYGKVNNVWHPFVLLLRV